MKSTLFVLISAGFAAAATLATPPTSIGKFLTCPTIKKFDTLSSAANASSLNCDYGSSKSEKTLSCNYLPTTGKAIRGNGKGCPSKTAQSSTTGQDCFTLCPSQDYNGTAWESTVLTYDSEDGENTNLICEFQSGLICYYVPLNGEYFDDDGGNPRDPACPTASLQDVCLLRS